MWKRVLKQLDRLLTVGAAPEPVELISFPSVQALRRWRVYSDKDFGGLSRGGLRLESPQQQHSDASSTTGPHSYAVLEGRYSKLLGEDCELVRSGYVGMSTLLPRALDLSLHDELVLTLRAHTRHAYVASLRTGQYSNASGEEAWQTLLTPTRVGEWETVSVPLKSLVFTFRGRVAAGPASSSTTTSPSADQQQGGPLLAPAHHQAPAGARTLGRPERARVVGLGLVLAATDDMPAEDDFRLDLAHVGARASRTDPVSDLVRAQLVELSAEDEARMEYEQRALSAARRLSPPGEHRRRRGESSAQQ